MPDNEKYDKQLDELLSEYEARGAVDATQKFDSAVTGGKTTPEAVPSAVEFPSVPKKRHGSAEPKDDERGADPFAPYPVKPRRRKKNTGCLGAVLYAVFVIAVSCLLAALLWIGATDVLALNKPELEAEVVIQENDSISTIAEKLYDAGLIEYKGLFRLFSDFADADEKIKPGTYLLNTSYDYNALVRNMSATRTLGEILEISFPEGFSMEQIFQRLEENEVGTVENLMDAAANGEFDYDFLDASRKGDAGRMEGFLFPDTYEFFKNESPETTLRRFLRNFGNRYTDEMEAAAAAAGLTTQQVVVIASMIEKEAANDEERSAIASVIFNRLDIDMRLQIDATVVYAMGADYVDSIDFEVDSPYNTYTNYGLPPGAICNPGYASIRAAIYPESTNYFYYALSVEGGHEFFRELSSFEDFINSDRFSTGK